MSFRKNSLENAYLKIISEANVSPSKTKKTSNVANTPIARQATAMADKISKEPKLPVLQSKVDISKLSWGDPIRDVEGRDMPEMTMDDYKRCILRAVRTRGSLLVYGDPGVGKTHTIYKMAPEIARQNFKREFINYSDFFTKSVDPETGIRSTRIGDSQKLKAYLDNPENYYILIEVQAQALEPVDLSGLYDIRSNTPYISNKVQLWAYVASLPGAAGILFFDEFNMAPEEVQNAFMKVTHPKERMVGSEKLADDFCVIAAANLGTEHGRSALDSAQTNRFSVGFIVLDPEAWLEWAHKENISQQIIFYVKSGTEYTPQGEPTGKNPTLYSPQREPNSPFPTPRQIALFDEELKDIIAQHEKELEIAIANGSPGPSERQLVRDIVLAAKAKCGSYWASGFASFMKASMDFEIGDVVKNPNKYFTVDDISKLNQLLYFLMSHLKPVLAKQERGEPLEEHDEQVKFATAQALFHLSREFTTILVRMFQRDLPIKQLQELINYFEHDVPDNKIRADLADKIRHVGAFAKGKI